MSKIYTEFKFSNITNSIISLWKIIRKKKRFLM